MTLFARSLWTLFVAAIPAIFSQNACGAASGGIRTVALSGMPAPGTNETFGDVGYSGVSLNNYGETAFIASPSFNNYEFVFEPRATTAINDESVWTEAGGSGLRRIAREGRGVPGDGTFAQLARPLIGDLGHTVYQGSFMGQPATPFYAANILRNRLGQADIVVAARGSIAPSTRVPYESIDSPSVNAHGEVAFFGTVNSSLDTFQGVWAELGGGALDLVARRGAGAPGTGGTFLDLSEYYSSDSSLAIGARGHVVFKGTFFTDVPHRDPAPEAIWLASPTGDLQVVVRDGDSDPAGGAFDALGPPRVNGRGEVAFSTGYFPAVWRYTAERGAGLVATQGQQAPGVDAVFASNHPNFTTFWVSVLGEEET
jgi:hypothetical protein